MADSKIKFAIGSVFDGEGFQAASQAIKVNQKELNATKKGLGEVTKAIGDINPTAKAAVGGVQSFVDAFAAGGIIGGSIQLAIMGVAKGIEYFTEKSKEAVEAWKTCAKVLRDELVEGVNAARDSFDRFTQGMTDAQKEAKGLQDALNGEIQAGANAKIQQLQLDALKKVAEDMTDGAKAVVEAEAALEIANVKGAAAVEIAQNKFKAAGESVELATQKRIEAERLVSETGEKVAKLQEANAPIMDKRKWIELELTEVELKLKEGRILESEAAYKTIEIKKKLADFDAEHAEQTKQLAEAEKALENAERTAYNAKQDEIAATRAKTAAGWALDQADEAQKIEVQKATNQLNNAMLKREEELDAIEEHEDALREQCAAAEEATEKQRLQAEAADELAKAQKTLAKDTKDGKTKGSDKIEVKVSANVSIDAGQMRDLTKPAGLDERTWEAIRNGKATVREWQRFQREAQKDTRDARNKFQPDMTRMAKLAQTPQAMWSKSDKAFFDTYKNSVAPKLSKDMALEMFKEGKKHWLTPTKWEQGTKTDREILKYLKEALGIQ